MTFLFYFIVIYIVEQYPLSLFGFVFVSPQDRFYVLYKSYIYKKMGSVSYCFAKDLCE